MQIQLLNPKLRTSRLRFINSLHPPIHKLRLSKVIFYNWLLLLSLTGAGLLFPARVTAQAQIQNQGADYDFGKQIRFHAMLTSESPPKSTTILINTPLEGETISGTVLAKEISDTDYELSYNLDLEKQPINPFSKVTYRYRMLYPDGNTYTSPEFSFDYIDNRFQWEQSEAKPFRIHWFKQADSAFPENVSKVAAAGLQQVQSLIQGKTPEAIDIYAYPSSTLMQEALVLSGQNWIAGHADPSLGVMILSIPPRPDQYISMQQIIPHELMHIMLYQRNPAGYANLPVWLNQGLASIAELYPNPDYTTILENDYKKNALLPMASLCEIFPRDASSALLAYAQSASFVRYLHGQYGTEGLQKLIDAQSDRKDCAAGVQAALGIPLSQVEQQWRKVTFGEDTTQVAIKNLIPWAVLLVLVLAAPLGIALLLLVIRPARRNPPSVPAADSRDGR